jgi:hypothetical protein
MRIRNIVYHIFPHYPINGSILGGGGEGEEVTEHIF